MPIEVTTIYDKNLAAYHNPQIRRSLNEGGTYSTKTWSILEILIYLAQEAKDNLLISIVSESLPHLKRGCIRDFFNILGEKDKNNPCYNMSEHVYTFGKGVIEFFGADESDKVRGPRRDILFINEGNNVPWDTARGLDIRTAKFTFVDWNPVSEFWAHTHWVGKPGNHYIHSTYQDAKHVLPQAIIDNIESNKGDPNWWNIYGLGLIGKVEGLVYPYFEIIEELPPGDSFFGLDFGFSGDPAVLTQNIIKGINLYSRELFFEPWLTNNDIANKFVDCNIIKNFDEIFADSAEPKSIEEIYQHHYNIKGTAKGPGSVEYGHQKIRQYKQHWTKDSVKCIKEQRNYRYIPDKDGKLTDKTTHAFSHGMDSRRYAVVGKVEPPEPEETTLVYDAIKAEGVNMDLH